MAETTKKTTERIFVDKGFSNEDPNHYISINGKTWLLPKGQYSDVPVEVAEEYARSKRAQAKFYETSDALINQGK